jgi:hypothetical protein
MPASASLQLSPSRLLTRGWSSHCLAELRGELAIGSALGRDAPNDACPFVETIVSPDDPGQAVGHRSRPDDSELTLGWKMLGDLVEESPNVLEPTGLAVTDAATPMPNSGVVSQVATRPTVRRHGALDPSKPRVAVAPLDDGRVLGIDPDDDRRSLGDHDIASRGAHGCTTSTGRSLCVRT